MKLVFIIYLVAIVLANIYVFFRLWTLMPFITPVKTVFVSLAALSFVSSIAFFTLGEKLPIPLTTALDLTGTSWLVIMLYLFLFFIAFDLMRLVGIGFAQKLLHHNLGTTIGLLAGMIALLTYGNMRYNHKERVELSLKTHRPLARPLRVVALSDVHLGYTITKDEVARWVKLINAERPDMILIAGDLVDGYLRPLMADGTADLLATLHAPLGVYACLGNHEYLADDRRAEAFLNRAGITMLRDSVAMPQGLLYVVGRDDRSNPTRRTVADLVSTLPDATKPIILLDHQPYDLDQSASAGVDLQLSGHTHRGQVWPISLITDAIYEKSHGYLKKSDTHIYVSSGIGLWGGKYRIGTQSEYVVIDLS